MHVLAKVSRFFPTIAMFDEWEKELKASQKDDNNPDGVLDLSLPKKHKRSDSGSFSSPETGRSSLSAASSSSSVNVEDNHSELDNSILERSIETSAKEAFMDLRYNKYNYTDETDDEDNSYDGPSHEKRRKCHLSQCDTSVFSRCFGQTTLSDDVSFHTHGEYDDRPIRCSNRGVTLSLHDESLWNAFRKVGTEMIINRGGRRMFPHVILSVTGLNPRDTYSIFLEIALADDRRFKYISDKWMGMGMADPSPRTKSVPHSDSPNLGSYWMQTRISFSKVRLTNNKDSDEDNILLLSMHKYKVIIKIRNESVQYDNTLTFVFDESTFIAVTAYQNNKITQLKIQNNPFAKAFRDAPHKKKGEGHRKNGSNRHKVARDLASFKAPSFKKSQLTSTPTERSDAEFVPTRFDPWLMYHSSLRTGQSPQMCDYPTSKYGLGHPGMFLNPTMMAQLSYFPFYSVSHQFGPQVRPLDSGANMESLPPEGQDKNRAAEETDHVSNTSDEYT